MAALGLLVILGAIAVIPALGARDRLIRGRAELEQARELLLAGDVGAANAAFEHAKQSFDEAGGYARNPLLRLAGAVPLAGRSFDAVLVLADAGGAGASAGAELTSAIAQMPGGLEDLGPSNGALPLDEIAALAPAIGRARARIDGALTQLRSLPTSWVVGPVADARDQAIAELARAGKTAASADALATALPSMLGADGTRRYFVAAQSPAELRGTGGFMGAYSILTAKDGRLDLGRMRSITDLPDVAADKAPPPPEGFGEPYASLSGTGLWRNLNMEPDAPTAARMIEALYRQVRGDRLDGVIFVDPQALADMLEATGPVDDPVLGRTLDSESIVDYLTNEAYLEFGSAAQRKRVLGAAVLSVFRRFLASSDPTASFRALADAGAGGHLILHATDRRVQDALETAGVAGTVDAPATGDLFGAFASNADATKIDFYVERSLAYDVTLDEDGGSDTRVGLTAENTAPRDPGSNYVFGPYPGTGLEPGVSKAFVTTYCSQGCSLQEASLDGEPHGLEAHRERGLPVFSTYVETAPQRTSDLSLALRQPDAWTGDELGGTYLLRIRAQPNVKATKGTITIHAPSGMRIVDASDGMHVDGEVATWTGDLDAAQEFEIRFQKTPLDRLWDFLSTPVFGD